MIGQIDREYLRAARLRTVPRLLSYSLFEGRPPTTRGQWANPVVLQHLRLAARVGPHRPVVRPIFLLGVGRSGTTLLGRLLSIHPHVGFLNEPKAMWHTVCPAEDVSGFYTPGPARFVLTAADADPRTRDLANRLFGYYCWLTRSPRLADKYPELMYRRAFLRAIFPDAVLVAIVRRPEAVVRSISAWTERHRVGDQDWWGVRSRKWFLLWEQLVASVPRRCALFEHLDPMAASPEERALTEWVVGMDELTSTTAQDPGADLLVRYEDLVARPEATMRGLLEAAGLTRSQRVLDFARRVVTQHPDRDEPSHDWGPVQPEVDRLLLALGYGG